MSTTKIITFKTFRKYCFAKLIVDLLLTGKPIQPGDHSLCVRTGNHRGRCIESNCPIWKRLRNYKGEK
ncbi:MAG: hypothetical protein KAU20_03290 [Nanoarchaeota archaeon]|nr:hypothetical protein [Nanoarchaeota archaeon]